MPRLMRGIARTAVVAGTATAVSNRVSRRQANRWSEQSAQQAPPPQQYAEPQYAEPQYAEPQYAPPPPAPALDPIDQLTKLAALKDQGVITESEFVVQKAKILGST